MILSAVLLALSTPALAGGGGGISEGGADILDDKYAYTCWTCSYEFYMVDTCSWPNGWFAEEISTRGDSADECAANLLDIMIADYSGISGCYELIDGNGFSPVSLTEGFIDQHLDMVYAPNNTVEAPGGACNTEEWVPTIGPYVERR